VRINVRHDIDDLANDMAGIARRAKSDMVRVVRKNGREGNQIARRFARQKAGLHGKNYFKRLTFEMTAPLSGEYGPEGTPKTDFVGVGFRHGQNMDLPNSADLIGPAMARDVRKLPDKWFW
jgi:hypothetical protein